MVCDSGEPIVKVISDQEGTDHRRHRLHCHAERTAGLPEVDSLDPEVNMIRSQSNRTWSSLKFMIITYPWPVASAHVEPTGPQPPAAPPGPSASIGPADAGMPAK
jgi:hypothetical protein